MPIAITALPAAKVEEPRINGTDDIVLFTLGLPFVSSFCRTGGERAVSDVAVAGDPADGAVQLETWHVDEKGRSRQRVRYAPLDSQRIAARIERSDDDGRTWRVI